MMIINQHSLSISIKRTRGKYFLIFKAVGKLTHQDYEMITPLLVSALSGCEKPRLDILIDITQFRGWSLRAAWNDFIRGLKHCGEFERVAVYGSQEWQRLLSKAGNWFIAGEVQYFENRLSAQRWIES